MSDNNNNTNSNNNNNNRQQYPFYIHDQYVKDLSFENPNPTSSSVPVPLF